MTSSITPSPSLEWDIDKIRFDRDGKPRKEYTIGPLVGKGGFATVCQLDNTTTKRPTHRVIKRPLISDNHAKIEDTSQAIRREYEILTSIGPCHGIITPPKYLLKCTHDGKKLYATIWRRYDETLGEHRLRIDDLVNAVEQTLYGLSRLHESRNHGDIKPGNILVLKKPRTQFSLSDFADARRLEDYKDRPRAGGHTNTFLPEEDYALLFPYHDPKSPKYHQFDETFFAIQKARDVAALALTFLAFIQQDACVYVNDRPCLAETIKKISSRVPITPLLIQMLTPDYRNRLTAQTAYETLIKTFSKISILEPEDRSCAYISGQIQETSVYSKTVELIYPNGKLAPWIATVAVPSVLVDQAAANEKVVKEYKLLQSLGGRALLGKEVIVPKALFTVAFGKIQCMIRPKPSGTLRALLKTKTLTQHQKQLLLGHLLYCLQLLHTTHVHGNLNADAIAYQIGATGKWVFFIHKIDSAKPKDEAKTESEQQQWLAKDMHALGSLIQLPPNDPFLPLVQYMQSKTPPTASDAYRQFIAINKTPSK